MNCTINGETRTKKNRHSSTIIEHSRKDRIFPMTIHKKFTAKRREKRMFLVDQTETMRNETGDYNV